jgi:GMP synthase (glutamine-hydrolysing)
MKPILIVKLGSTFPPLAAAQGDFEHWVAKRLGVADEEIRIAGLGTLPTDARGYRGVVLTGAHASVTDRAPWSLAAGDWLRRAVDQDVATLGICYGHQLLADVFGGRVGPNPAGREVGTIEVTLTQAARRDPLLEGLASRVFVQACHGQTVLTPPPGAVTLAHGAMDPLHAFRLGERAWGVQFHPEFDERATRFYAEHFRDVLSETGQDVEAILARIRPTPDGEAILRRFAELTAEL